MRAIKAILFLMGVAVAVAFIPGPVNPNPYDLERRITALETRVDSLEKLEIQMRLSDVEAD